MLDNFFNDKSCYKTILAIAIPISIQSLFQDSLSVIDQLIGQLGENGIAAIGLGSRFPFIFITTLCAIPTTASIFFSQFWSGKDIKSIGHAFGGTLVLGMSITIIFSLISLAFPKQILALYSRDEKITEMGISYLRIIAISYIPRELVRKILILCVSLVINEFMRSLGETMYSIVYERMETSQVAL